MAYLQADAEEIWLEVAPTPRQKLPEISPIFISDKVALHVSREKDGKSGLLYAQFGRFQTDLRREVPALRCPAVTCNVS